MSVNELQGSPRGLLLQRAADGCHRRSQSIETVQFVISFAFALAAVLATVRDSTASLVGLAAAAWAFFSLFILSRIDERSARDAAIIQEQFDTFVFDLPWSSSGPEPVPDEELRRRSRKSRLPEDRVLSWYPNVESLPHPYAVLACQRENLTWDWRLRRRWASLLACFAAGWLFAGVGISLLLDRSVRELCLQWIVPSASIILLAVHAARVNLDVATEREGLSRVVRGELDAALPGEPSSDRTVTLLRLCRSIQDGILRSRLHSKRVPSQVYEIMRPKDEEDMQETIADTRARLGFP